AAEHCSGSARNGLGQQLPVAHHAQFTLARGDQQVAIGKEAHGVGPFELRDDTDRDVHAFGGAVGPRTRTEWLTFQAGRRHRYATREGNSLLGPGSVWRKGGEPKSQKAGYGTHWLSLPLLVLTKRLTRRTGNGGRSARCRGLVVISPPSQREAGKTGIQLAQFRGLQRQCREPVPVQQIECARSGRAGEDKAIQPQRIGGVLFVLWQGEHAITVEDS